MTPAVHKGRDGAWRWEIIDDDGETYLRSERSFADSSIAKEDLKVSSHLIYPHLSHV